MVSELASRSSAPGFKLWLWTLCCVLELHTLLFIVPLSAQVYKWAPANLCCGGGRGGGG